MRKTIQAHNDTDNTFLNDVIAIRDELWAQEHAENELVPGELSQIFAMLDPDLLALHKDMKTAAAQHAHAKKTGQMRDILKWRFESAESAYQTRLLEVRRNKLTANNKKVSEREKREKRELHELSMQQSMNEQFAKLREKRLKEKRRKDDKTGSGLFFFILGMWLAQINAQRLEQDRLRYSFANAKTM